MAVVLATMGGRPGQMPASDWYETSRQQIVQADLTYRMTMYFEQVAGVSHLPALGGLHDLREKAVAAYERAILVPRPNPLALQRLGIIYGERGYAEQAQEVLMRAAALDETHASLYFALSAIYGPDKRVLPPPSLLQVRQQEQWLADLALAAYYHKMGASTQAAQIAKQAERATHSFGVQFLLLISVAMVLGLIGLCVVVIALIRSAFFVHPARPVRPPLLVPWEAVDAVEVVCLLYVALVVLGIIAGLALHYMALKQAPDTVKATIAALQYLLFTSIALSFIWKRVRAPRPRRLRVIGLRAPHLWRMVAQGIAGYGVIVVILALVAMTTGASGIVPGQGGEQLMSTLKDPGARVILFVLICLVAPVIEEVIFRGFVYPGLRRRLHFFPAVVSSALLFALMHNNPQSLIPIGLIGIVLAVLYERNRSLIPSIIAHALNNSLVFFLFLLSS